MMILERGPIELWVNFLGEVEFYFDLTVSIFLEQTTQNVEKKSIFLKATHC